MKRIVETFKRVEAAGERALITFIMAGDGGLEATAEYVRALVAGGADLVELGVPFSDPVADGPVNQAAAQRALAAGIHLEEILQVVERLRGEVDVPLLLMGYLNPFYQYGLERFCKDAVAAGVDGLIIADLPPREAGLLASFAEPAGLGTIFLAAPTSSPQRLREVAEASRGFIYCVARPGVTGESEQVAPEAEALVQRLRAITDLPLAVGFGIKSPKQARKVAGFADGIIVGSALVRLISEAASVEKGVENLKAFAQELKSATRLR